MDQCGSAFTLKTPKQKLYSFYLLYNLKIQVFGLLGHLSSYITIFILDAYRTVSLTVTLIIYIYYMMRILILRWASHLDAFSGYPLHT